MRMGDKLMAQYSITDFIWDLAGGVQLEGEAFEITFFLSGTNTKRLLPFYAQLLRVERWCTRKRFWYARRVAVSICQWLLLICISVEANDQTRLLMVASGSSRSVMIRTFDSHKPNRYRGRL